MIFSRPSKTFFIISPPIWQICRTLLNFKRTNITSLIVRSYQSRILFKHKTPTIISPSSLHGNWLNKVIVFGSVLKTYTYIFTGLLSSICYYNVSRKKAVTTIIIIMPSPDRMVRLCGILDFFVTLVCTSWLNLYTPIILWGRLGKGVHGRQQRSTWRRISVISTRTVILWLFSRKDEDPELRVFMFKSNRREVP